MGAIYTFDNRQTFLGISIPITIFNVAALIGSVVLGLRTWQQYRIIHALSIVSTLSLLISQILIYVIEFGSESRGLVAATMLFENIFVPLAWCLLVRVALLAGEARLRFHDPAKHKKVAQSDVYVKTWTGVLIAVNVGVAIAYGINKTDNRGYTSMYLLQYFSNILFPMQLILLLVSATYHRDIRPFAISFYAAFIFLTCVSAGSVTIGVFTLIDRQLALTGTLQTVMIRFIGSIALLMIIVLFPTNWIRCIRENQAKNDFMPAAPLDDNDSWNPNASYDTNYQDTVQIDNDNQHQWASPRH